MEQNEIGWMIGRPINGITINPLEWILDENDKPMLFDTKDDAINYLKASGVTDDEIEDLRFYVQINCPGCGETLELPENSFLTWVFLSSEKQRVFRHLKCETLISVPVKEESRDAK